MEDVVVEIWFGGRGRFAAFAGAGWLLEWVERALSWIGIIGPRSW